jgi:hypothetical protein
MKKVLTCDTGEMFGLAWTKSKNDIFSRQWNWIVGSRRVEGLIIVMEESTVLLLQYVIISS